MGVNDGVYGVPYIVRVPPSITRYSIMVWWIYAMFSAMNIEHFDIYIINTNPPSGPELNMGTTVAFCFILFFVAALVLNFVCCHTGLTQCFSLLQSLRILLFALKRGSVKFSGL